MIKIMRGLLITCITLCLLFGGMNVPSAMDVSADAERPIKDGVYQIASKIDTAYCLDIFAEASLDGTDVILWTRNTNNNFMKFRFTYLNSGYYKITNVGSNKVLEVEDTSVGSTVQQNSWDGSNRQKWKLHLDSKGFFEISPKSTPSCRINISSGKAQDWQYIYADKSDESNSQKWQIIPMKKPEKTSISSFKSTKSKSATVKWKKVDDDADGYQVQIARDSSFSNDKKTGYTTSENKSFSGLAGGKKYYARVRAYVKVGTKNYFGKWSKVLSTTVLKGAPISKASLTKVNSPGKKKIFIQWKALKNVDGYQVRISTKKDFSSNTIERVYKSSVKKMTITRMKSKKAYYVKVRGKRKESGVNTYGAWSTVKKVKVK